MNKFSVVILFFFIFILFTPKTHATPITITFDSTPFRCRGTLPTTYSESGMRIYSSAHVHICENHQGQTQSLRNHRGSVMHAYIFEYLDGKAFDLISFDLSTRFRNSDSVEWHPGRSTFTSSSGGSTTIDTLGTSLFSGPEWQNITWLRWDQGTNTQFSIRNTNTVLDNLVFQPTTAPVPEPAAMLLFGSGLLGVITWRLFSKKADAFKHET